MESALRICPLCEATCGLELTLRAGQPVGARGDELDTFSHGFLCPKGVALPELHADPDRLRTPLVRRDGVLVEATWAEAFAAIERGLTGALAHGRDSVGVAIGNPTVHRLGLVLYGPRLLRALGSKNVYSASTLDQMPKQLSSGLMFGHWLSIPVPDIERTDWMLILGANPMASNGSLWTVPHFRGKAKALRARGGRLVVIDPRRTETAAVADEHLTIRPGADVFLLLGMVHTLFAEALVRLGRLAEHVVGVEAVEAAVAPFAPEVVAPRCGMEPDTIRRLAHALAGAERGVVYGRIGTCTQAYGTLCSWLVDVLNLLTGNLDEPGGAMFPKAPAFAANTMGPPGKGRGVLTGRYRSRVSGAPEVYGELPMGCLAEEIDTGGEGRIRALLTIASNPVLSAPNGPRLAAALDRLDFMVSLDAYVNETTSHAHVVLPARSPLEEPHYDVAFTQLAYRNNARFSPAVLPAADHPSEWEVLLRLQAIVTGRGAQADIAALDEEALAAEVRKHAGPLADAVLDLVKVAPAGPERWLDLALRAGPYGDKFGLNPGGLSLQALREAPHGVDLGPLEARIPEVLRTPSGRVELAPAPLLADLDRALADLESPAAPLVVIGRRHVRSNNSWMHNLPSLAKGRSRCTALVHPADAARYGLVHGGKARLAAGERSLEVEVEVSDEVMVGVVSVPHGWGHDTNGARLTVAAQRPGVSLNRLFDGAVRDPLSGNAVLSGWAVTIAPVG